MKKKVIIFAFVITLMVSKIIYALDVSDLNLKVPFPSGEVWRTSCGYEGNINGIYDPGCWAHASGTKDERALDFNHYNQQSSPDDCGRTLVAVADGIVKDIRYSINEMGQGYGWIVDIYHGDNYLSRYAHLEEKPDLEKGVFVFRGQDIAKCGKSGTVDCHLHFVLYKIKEDGTLVSIEPEPMDGYQDLRIGGSSYLSTNVAHPLSSINQASLDQFCRDNDPHPLVERFRNSTTGKIEVTYSPGDNKVWYYTALCNIESYNVALSDIYDGKGGSYEQNCLGEVKTEGGDDYEEPSTFDGPDGNVKRMEVSDDGTHWHSSFLAYPGQKLKAEITCSNKGDETIDYWEVFLHRSPDKDFNQEHDYSYGREEETDDLLPGEERAKHRDFTAPNTPGLYYLFAYINRVDGKNGGIDQHWENNVSRNDDREEYVPLYVQIPEPWASFSVNPKLGLSPLTVQFSDTSRWSPTAWFWDFGDGLTSTAQHPVHVYSTGGSYTVTLTVSNEKGSTKTAQIGCVKVDIPPSFLITNPTATDNWRSSDTKDIKWEARNFPSKGTVKIEYSLNDGSSWRVITNSTDNDGIKHWQMCDSYTIDTKNARIRITSNLYPNVQKVSPRFEIDHARGCR